MSRNDLNDYINYLKQQEKKKRLRKEQELLAKKQQELEYLDLIAKFNIDTDERVLLFEISAGETKHYIKYPFHDTFEGFITIVTETIGKGYYYVNSNKAQLTSNEFNSIWNFSVFCHKKPVHELTFITEEEFNKKHAKTLIFRSMVDGEVFKLDSYMVSTFSNLLSSVRTRFPSCNIIFKGFKLDDRNFEKFKHEFETSDFFIFY
ncbi:hypothetical protein Hokovirus_1_272 [Hokovirus HKV1]|uniref:Uncharacterized protein n=1 Tax=Hokovirus HKV1 TaxID=1977638 RepID=A0A1V0SFB0_9VIRU|nr:hypothetical protein Hokovirus_1_272 [Hokovirus HKV1]